MLAQGLAAGKIKFMSSGPHTGYAVTDVMTHQSLRSALTKHGRALDKRMQGGVQGSCSGGWLPLALRTDGA